MKRTIDFLTKSGLCAGCGACISLCPVNALELKLHDKMGVYFPELHERKCIECSICYWICPIISFIKERVEKKATRYIDMFIGSYMNCYVGYAKDYEIRYNASSGGLVTQLLIYALESGIIDGALVTRMKKDDPLKPEPFIARTKEELMEAAGSKYCPVPVNLPLRYILKTERNEKFAVVGLPCQIRAIKNAENINRELREKIVLHIGLFCSHVPNFFATDIFLQRLGIRKENIAELKYRGGGWPGFMKISLKTGKTYKVALPLYWRFLGLDFFIPRSCLLCDEALSESADISVGDAWLPEFSSDKLGTSIIIVRNLVGKNIVENAEKLDKIKISEISYKKVIQSQLATIYFKKINLRARAKLFGIPLSCTSAKVKNVNYFDYSFAIFTYLNSQVLSRSFIVKKLILKKVPMRIIDIYYFLPNILYSKALNSFKKTFLESFINKY
jgi:coenzyme F420 hydrogenase subunit beta